MIRYIVSIKQVDKYKTDYYFDTLIYLNEWWHWSYAVTILILF